MECWICGDEATTGEHRIKHSDLKGLYPNISQETPLYHRRDGIKQKYIRSIKSNKLKFDALLCAKCNNEKTQVYDKAWEKLSNYLQTNWDNIVKAKKINITNVFQGTAIENMIDVQLFFVKIFGCYIREVGVPVSLLTFSTALLERSEHPNIYFSFRESEIDTTGNYISISDIEIWYEPNNQNNIYYIHMFYTLNKITVDLIYCLDETLIELNGAIKPSQIMDNQIKLSKLNYKSALPEYIQSTMTNYKTM